MSRSILALLFALAFAPLCAGAADNPRVTLETTVGDITLELYPERAPETVKNFLGYVRNGHYDGLIFHRVIKNFMIQGGGFTPDMEQREVGAPIANEADNGLKNEPGTIAMARTSDPHSATAQFFINTVDNFNLNHRMKTRSGWGYCVFGKVVDGMDTVREIERQPTDIVKGFADVPLKQIVITKARVAE